MQVYVPTCRRRRRAICRQVLLQRCSANQVSVQAGVPRIAGVGDCHQLRIVEPRHVEPGTRLLVDLRLIHLDLGLVQQTPRDDDFSAVVVRGLDDIASLFRVLLELGGRPCVAVADPLLVVTGERLVAEAFDPLVQLGWTLQ